MPAKDKKKISLIHSHSDAPDDMSRSTPARNVCSLHLTLLFISFFISTPCNSIDFITSTQPLKDGQTIVSAGMIFELGFFSPGKTKNRYVGIWYKQITVQTVIWVANRETPIKNSSGIFTIDDGGNLVVSDGKSIFWSSNASVSFKNPTGKLLDTGNLVLTDGDSSVTDSRVLAWQSIDHPTDTFIPFMKLGINKKSGKNKAMKSWKSPDDPAQGRFLVSMDTQVPPQAYLYNGSRPIWRTGQWNGKQFIGMPKMISIYPGFNLITEDQSTYITYTPSNSSFIGNLVLDWSGELKATVWLVNGWVTAFKRSKLKCEVYDICGHFGICNDLDSPNCNCMQGFVPKSVEEWKNGNWTSGCIRRQQFGCAMNGSGSSSNSNSSSRSGGGGNGSGGKADGFWKLERMKLPDFAEVVPDASNAAACESVCLKNCSCVAYAQVTGIGCMIWEGDLMDLREFTDGGEELFIRLAHSEFGHKKRKGIYIIVLSVILGIVFLGTFTWMTAICVAKRRVTQKRIQELFSTRTKASKESPKPNILKGGGGNNERDPELPLFSLSKIAIATNNFSDANKLGEGGFGPVYKGMLEDGQEIAVKRLSSSSRQGLEELKNEVILISKLQHRNLVRLLGCCIEEEEKLLLYEFMPNKSLDAFLFDPTKRMQLDWLMRFSIIEGIARGLIYLHRDSRLKVIHRDLKSGNILLDDEMNPKISDFGMARIFGGKQTQANTNRVVGTYGYMAPEYAMEGLFSEKSDVFSFGVLLLEIVSGKRNNSFYHYERYQNLLGHAWRLWNEGNVLHLIDPTLVDTYSEVEVTRCIHVGLLCVQERAANRPTMSAVVSMLGSETATLPAPRQPAFTLTRSPQESESSSTSNKIFSINGVTVTEIDGR